MSSLTYLITGANRSLGLGFVERILGTELESRVIAACRDPSKAEALQRLARGDDGRVQLVSLDVVSQTT